MGDEQHQRRVDSLRAALDGLSESRQMRIGPVPSLMQPYEIADEETRGRRRRLFRFADRARAAVADD